MNNTSVVHDTLRVIALPWVALVKNIFGFEIAKKIIYYSIIPLTFSNLWPINITLNHCNLYGS